MNEREFYNGLARFRDQGERPRAVQIAKLACEAGMSAYRALQEIIEAPAFGPPPNNNAVQTVHEFVETLFEGDQPKRLLEYTVTPNLLSALIQTHDAALLENVLISPNSDIAEAFGCLFPRSLVHVSSDHQILNKTSEYDAIFCQPPIGYRPPGDKKADGFGGEIIQTLIPHLSQGGILCWLTARSVWNGTRHRNTRKSLEEEGFFVQATIDLPPDTIAGTNMEGLLLVLSREKHGRRLAGALRDSESARGLASELLNGPSKARGPSWQWLESGDNRTYSDIEQEQHLARLIPRGRHAMVSLGELLLDEPILKADKDLTEESTARAFLYIPEYASSRVTAQLADQSVKPKAVYRLPIRRDKANPEFLALLLNGQYGRQARSAASKGATIARVSVSALKHLPIPLPDLATQNSIASVAGDLGLLVAEFDDVQNKLQSDWTGLPEITDQVNALKAVLDVERRIENWWQELPYPLAAIYRRYQVATDPKERLDRLLHFFEMMAVYLAVVGTSHVKALRADWKDQFAKWFHPATAAGIERADFGFWIVLAGASLKDLSRIASDKDLRDTAEKLGGPDLVSAAATLGPLGKVTPVLDIARRYRNSSKGHGGHLKSSDAERLEGELQQSVRALYETAHSVFRQLVLVRPGLAEVSDSGLLYKTEILRGSDPAFGVKTIELDHRVKSNSMAFWIRGARAMCKALPFFRLGAPQEPQESSFYVFNRVENGGFRWISYHEARQQEFVASDDELLSLIENT